MQGKHNSIFKHAAAWLYRERVRHQLSSLVSWTPLADPEPGCTAIIGMCSRLPRVLGANLRCLIAARWPELRRIVIAVDATREGFPLDEQALMATYPGIEIKVVHYSPQQSRYAEGIKLPFVYSWMSWSIALAEVKTRDVLIHDYDALVFGETLQRRYDEFVRSKAMMQGVSWYAVNGLQAEDRLATTFEAFAQSPWLRSLAPVSLFNKIGIKDGRSIDYDTTLHIQDRLLRPEQRTCMPMDLDELVHPSQMIHQYTMFRKFPGRPLPSFSMPMLPLFAALSGKPEAFDEAAASLRTAARDSVDLAGDGTPMNLEQLGVPQVNWTLKQMIQAAVLLGLPDNPALANYGDALYDHVGATHEQRVGDFTPRQADWLHASRRSA
jgi:hypothetical protein